VHGAVSFTFHPNQNMPNWRFWNGCERSLGNARHGARRKDSIKIAYPTAQNSTQPEDSRKLQLQDVTKTDLELYLQDLIELQIHLYTLTSGVFTG